MPLEDFENYSKRHPVLNCTSLPSISVQNLTSKSQTCTTHWCTFWVHCTMSSLCSPWSVISYQTIHNFLMLWTELRKQGKSQCVCSSIFPRPHTAIVLKWSRLSYAICLKSLRVQLVWKCHCPMTVAPHRCNIFQNCVQNLRRLHV